MSHPLFDLHKIEWLRGFFRKIILTAKETAILVYNYLHKAINHNYTSWAEMRKRADSFKNKRVIL
jgi:hypothetical protein